MLNPNERRHFPARQRGLPINSPSRATVGISNEKIPTDCGIMVDSATQCRRSRVRLRILALALGGVLM